MARHPSRDGIGPTLQSVPPQLVSDWREAEDQTASAAVARISARSTGSYAKPDTRVPRYFLDFLRFGADEGERHATLFRCAAWLIEQGAPPSLASALLTEPGCDVGLTPKDVERQIACGIEHAHRQRGAAVDPDPMPDDEDAGEAWAIAHQDDSLRCNG